MTRTNPRTDWPWLRAKLAERSAGACERCGVKLRPDAFEAHHRKLRSGQGKDVLSNLVALCRDCHTGSPNGVHSRVAEAKKTGFIVSKFADPAPVPIEHAAHGWVLLFDDGSWQPAMFAEPGAAEPEAEPPAPKERTYRMNREDAEEYTQALGQVVAGGWRQVALGKRLGVPQALGLSVAEWVERRLGGYVRMSIPDRRGAVAELAEEGESDNSISQITGVDRKTIRKWHEEGEEIPSEEPASTGSSQPTEPLGELVAEFPTDSEPEPTDEESVPGPDDDLTPDDLSDVIDSSDHAQAYQDARWRQELVKEIGRLVDLKTFPPERVVAVCDDDQIALIDSVHKGFNAWHREIARLRKPGLRIVSGGPQ